MKMEFYSWNGIREVTDVDRPWVQSWDPGIGHKTYEVPTYSLPVPGSNEKRRLFIPGTKYVCV